MAHYEGEREDADGRHDRGRGMGETPGQVLWRTFGYDERPLGECPRPTQDLYNGVAAAFLAAMRRVRAVDGDEGTPLVVPEDFE